jgi:CHAT domain-containing protein/Tfp pilus assembly protein PilF
VRSMMGAAYAAGGDVAQAVPLLSDVVAAFRDMGRAPEADRAAGWLERARAGDRLDDLFVFSPPREGADVHDVTSPEAFVRRYREAQESLGARQYDRAAAILEELLILARQRDAEEVEAELLISLGFSYRRLDRPSEALLAYQEALAAARRHGDREREARALNNLGVVYASLNQKEEALGYLQAAARIRETFDDKQEWGETLVSLAAISSEPEARELLTQALAHLDPDRQPSAWVAAYRDLKRSLEGKALDAFLRTHRATAQSLGIDTEQPAQTGQRFERIQPVRGEGLEFALVMQAPEERHRTGEGDVAARQASAEMLVLLGMKDAAVAELQAALEIVERLRSQISSAADRERAFAGQWQIYDRLIGLLIEAERFPEALETIERVKTRSLLDLLHQIDHLPPGVPDELRARYRRLRLDQRQKERQLADAQASPSAGRSESLEVARQEFLKAGLALEEVLQQVRLYAPEVDPGQPFPVVGFAEMQALVRSPAHAFVVYWLGRQAQGVLVVSKGELVFRSLERVGELGAAVEEYQRLLAAGMDAGTEGDFRSLLGRLYPILIQPIAAEMEGLEDITFIPHHTLHLLPLHALDDGCQTLIDRYTIDYAPSFSLLQVCRDHKRQAAASQRLLLVDNPDGSLDYAAVEAGQVRRLFGEAHVLPGQAGTARAIGQHLPAAAYSHFACHGDFQPDRPDRIALVVAQEGEHTGYLTREEILTRFRAAYGSTVVLSACNSGRTLLGATDEFVGLPSAFLIAGASAVVGSLWPVYDVSTALLMGEFYRWHLGVGEDVTPPLAPAAALRAAQRWLRGATAGELAVRFQAERGAPESERSMPYALASALWGRFAALEPGARPFEQPVYWAAFTCTGA